MSTRFVVLALLVVAACSGTGGPKIPAGQVLLSTAGDGTGDTQTFDAPAEWRVDYTLTCPATIKPPVPFSLYVWGKQTIYGQTMDDAAALFAGSLTSLTGTAQAHMAGRVYLRIASACPWSLTARS